MIEKIFNQFLKCRSVTTDTRAMSQGAIFFALKGDNFNGNTFAQQALDAGCSLVVVDEEQEINDDRLILVEDSLKALQQLSGLYRDTFQFPVIAITGSNGKTTTKELMMAVLERKFRVHATKGNLNNHIGVPLTLLATPKDTEIAIIEMGANHQREIASYCEYAKPDFGLITNIGKAHLEGFGGEEGVKKGKRELYDYIHARGGKVFVNVELDKLNEVSEGMERVEYGFETGKFQLNVVGETPFLSFEIAMSEGQFVVHSKLSGVYNLYNFASAIAVGQYFGVTMPEQIVAMESYNPDNNRSQIVKTSKNTLIMDAYNANPTSMEHALRNLSKQTGKQFFVIGDMRELGDSAEVEHRNIISLVKELGLIGITVGEEFEKVNTLENIRSFKNNDEARPYLEGLTLESNIILIKGSRGIRLEQLKDIF
ncbi:MAG: UDP-N-acetylmuramoyl-tripeptide--D-alanyl-D-alanine ligase [Flavobacteriales bacterium]